MGLNVSPPIGQSYINTIPNCLESRKYRVAIMDDLLLFTHSKQLHMKKLEDLLKALLKNGLKISLSYNIWVIPSLSKEKEYVKTMM